MNYGAIYPRDRVILLQTDYPQLQSLAGQRGTVKSVQLSLCPQSAVVTFDLNNIEAAIYTKNLVSIPPSNSPIQYGETVKVVRLISSNKYHLNKHFLNKIADIVAYDSQDNCYCLKDNEGVFAWFPIKALIPLLYKGEHFFYPGDFIIYKNTKQTIDKIRGTQFNRGQLLLVDGNWVPSSDVKPA